MSSPYESDKERYRQYLIAETHRSGKEEEIRTAPLFSLDVKHLIDNAQRPEVLPQYGLLGHHIGNHKCIGSEEPILLNVNAPNSAFICGSQGSGKSYTLSCVLETCLVRNPGSGSLETPVSGVVFHYDVDATASVSEAAYLVSQGIPVDVYVSQSNQSALTEAYKKIDPKGNLQIKPLLFRSSDLNIERMLKLMALSEKEGPVPLYMEVIQRILRQMAVANSFTYASFKAKLGEEHFSKDQNGPLNLRLALLESFMEPEDIASKFYGSYKASKLRPKNEKKNLFDLKPGTLTIIDLSDPFVEASTACILFSICLGLIIEQRPPAGLVIALDEAHKFMNKSPAANSFTERLLTTIREQRHNATRVVIATQEPTISEKLLDLCSVSIIHRFTSPAWFTAIKDHLSGASAMVSTSEQRNEMFEQIVDLNVGESLVFSPSAFVSVENGVAGKLGPTVMKMKTRCRVGDDGGVSKLASGSDSLLP